LFIAEEIANNAVYCLSMSSTYPEILALKVKRFPNTLFTWWSWLDELALVSWMSQRDVCLTFAQCSFRVSYALCIFHICSMFAWSCKQGINHAKFWMFFTLSNFKVVVSPKGWTHVIMPSCLPSGTSRGKVSLDYSPIGLVAWRSGSTFHKINEVILRWLELVLGWVTAFGQINHLIM